MFTVRTATTMQGNGFAVAVLALAMLLDHPNFAATVLRISLNSGAQTAILNFNKIIIFGQVTVIGFQMSLWTKFHLNWFTLSAFRRP